MICPIYKTIGDGLAACKQEILVSLEGFLTDASSAVLLANKINLAALQLPANQKVAFK